MVGVIGNYQHFLNEMFSFCSWPSHPPMTNWTSYYKMHSWKDQTWMVRTVTTITMLVLWMCQVKLFAPVRSPTDQLLSRMGLASDNTGSNRVHSTEEGPCQWPALSSTQPKEATSPRLHTLYTSSHAWWAWVHAVHINIFCNEIGVYPPTNKQKCFVQWKNCDYRQPLK